MINDLSQALSQLLYERGRIDPLEVDVCFDAPIKQWIAGRTRPTLDLFLYDLDENTDLRQTQMQTTRANGQGVHRLPPRRFDLRYMVSAITTDVADEHLLLWRALMTLMKYPTLPAEVLSEHVRALDIPVVTRVEKPTDSPRALDIWSALDALPRPALFYVVTVPIDLEMGTDAPLVLTRTTRYTPTPEPPTGPEIRTHIGGTVADRKGRPVVGARVAVQGRARDPVITNQEGAFTLTDMPSSGAVTLQVVRDNAKPALVKIAIPSPSYVVVVD